MARATVNPKRLSRMLALDVLRTCIQDKVETCGRCDGSGADPRDTQSACPECGGGGETLDLTGYLTFVDFRVAAGLNPIGKQPKGGK